MASLKSEVLKNTIAYLKKAIPKSKEGPPVFIMVRLPSACGINAFRMIKTMQDQMKEDDEINRHLYFLPPRDLVATYKTWANSSQSQYGVD